MSKQIKCKNILTDEEKMFDSLAACLDFLGVKNKALVMTRVNGKNKVPWKDQWIFAYQDKEYNDYNFDDKFDPSTRRGTKTTLTKGDEVLKFNSKNKAREFLGIKDKNCFLEGMIYKGYTVTFN